MLISTNRYRLVIKMQLVITWRKEPAVPFKTRDSWLFLLVPTSIKNTIDLSSRSFLLLVRAKSWEWFEPRYIGPIPQPTPRLDQEVINHTVRSCSWAKPRKITISSCHLGKQLWKFHDLKSLERGTVRLNFATVSPLQSLHHTIKFYWMLFTSPWV